LIQNEIKKPLAEELLFGKLVAGGLVKVGVKDRKLTFDHEAAAKPVKPKQKKKKRPSGGTSKIPATVK
jgi:ATP-dependent Clp protease ATP-binding subunit ClpA